MGVDVKLMVVIQILDRDKTNLFGTILLDP